MKESVTKFDLMDAFKALNELEYPEVKGGIKARKDDYKPLHENLAKRAMRTDMLIEDYYNVGMQEDLENAADDREAEVAKAKLARIEKIVDLDAESEEDLLTSYTGKVIIQCPQCMTLFYKNEEDLSQDEENPDVVNINETCQHCGNNSGYMVIGKVAPVEEEELNNFEDTEAGEANEAEEDNELNLDFDEEEQAEEPAAEEENQEKTEEENEEDLDLDLNLEDEEANESLNISKAAKSENKSENESDKLTLNESADNIEEDYQECPKCGGSGVYDGDTCSRCYGHGYLSDHLQEAEEAEQPAQTSADITPEKAFANNLKNTTDSYETWVKKLQKLLNVDCKGVVFKDYLAQHYGEPDLPKAVAASASEKPIAIKDLHPTQNEVDIDKSLSYPLTKADLAGQLLTGKDITIGGNPIIVYDGGKEKYIIDGHHRWSQTYCVNPDATMQAIVFANVPSITWDDMLKAMQLSIAATSGKIKVDTVEGKNLFKISDAAVKQYVISNITDDVLEVFKANSKGDSKEAVADYIAQNVKTMQEHCQPAKGAGGRGTMPQTDDASIKKAMSTLIDVTEGVENSSTAEQKLKAFVNSLEECGNKPTKKFVAGIKEAVEIKVLVNEIPDEEACEGGICVEPICADGVCEEPAEVIEPVEAEEIAEVKPEVIEEPIEDAPVEGKEEEAEEIPAEEEVEDEEIPEEEEEEVEESLNNAKAAKLENKCKNKSKEAAALNEEAEVSDVEIAELLNSKEFNEPISDAEIEAVVDEDFGVDKLDDIDEDSLNECITNSLTDVYENVNNFTTKDCSLVNGKLVVEGVINFKSGNTKASTYIFNKRVKKQNNNYVLTGINEDLDKNGSFSLIGKLTNHRKNFIAESLRYKYNIGKALIKGLANRK